MVGYVSFSSLFLFAFLASLISYTQQRDPMSLYHSCSNTTTYSKSSTYSSNLKSLLSSLSSNNTFPFFSNGFYSNSAGQSSDMVFVRFLCQGGLSPERCRENVVSASKDILNRCPEEKKGWILYDECMLHYTDQNFVYDSSVYNGHSMYSHKHVSSNSEQFKASTFSLLSISATEAAGSSRKFNAREENLSALHVYAQCTPDLTREDCLSCLKPMTAKLLDDVIGGRLIALSCNSRYELYSFYNESAIRSLPPASPSTPPGKGGGNSFVIIIAVVVPIVDLILKLLSQLLT